MLPSFTGPVRWRPTFTVRPGLVDLLQLEAAEFEAVLGRRVDFTTGAADPGAGAADGAHNTWTIDVDPDLEHARLRADLHARCLRLTVPTPGDLEAGLQLLHTLAHTPGTVVEDTDAGSYGEGFDRIYNEVRNIYPSLELRGLDWDAITDRHSHVRDLTGPAFWNGAASWVAELGDAHTQLVDPAPRHHPPYIAAMTPRGAVLEHVPADTFAWAAGVRPGHLIDVEDPEGWLRRTGASPQHHSRVAARRFVAMTDTTRSFTATGPDGTTRHWVEQQDPLPSLVAARNTIHIRAFTAQTPELLSGALTDADPADELVVDLRGNTGGNLLAAARARRLLVREAGAFGAVRFTTGTSELAAPAPLSTMPHPDGWPGLVNVLIDSMTYSAAEDFLHPLVGAPHVRITGGPTGGGSGRPHSRAIYDGIRINVSTAITYTRTGAPIEYRGIHAQNPGGDTPWAVGSHRPS